MTLRTTIGKTSFSMSFKMETVILVEVGMPSPKVLALDGKSNFEKMRV